MCIYVSIYTIDSIEYMEQTNQNECLQFFLCAAIFFFSLQSIKNEITLEANWKKKKKKTRKSIKLLVVWFFFIGTSTYKWLKMNKQQKSNRQVIVDAQWEQNEIK